MRPINFLIIFVFCFALVLFSLENSQPVTIHVVPNVELQAPLCLGLMVAMGTGAVLAWIFAAWSRLLGLLAAQKAKRAIREKENQIKALEKDLEQYKVETMAQNQLLAGSLPPAEVETR